MWGSSSISELFVKGGLVMWPLLACSIVGLAIIAERAIHFWRIRLNYRRFLATLVNKVRTGNLAEIREFCHKHRSPIAHLACLYVHNLNETDQLRNDILRREGSLMMEAVEKRLRMLSMIAHIAPLLGLLGTVGGLVTAFHSIETLAGVVRPSDLAGGIWEALLTTVFGLVIAIPCMAAYYGFEHKADQIARRMQFVVSELNEFFGKTNGESMPKRAELQEEITAVE
jgi:biopolymer transport protein ExbB